MGRGMSFLMGCVLVICYRRQVIAEGLSLWEESCPHERGCVIVGGGVFSWIRAQPFGKRRVLVRGRTSLWKVCPSGRRQDLDEGGVYLDVT